VSASPSVSPSPSVAEIVPPPEPIFNRNHQIVERKTVNAMTPATLIENRLPSWNTLGKPKKPKLGTYGFNFQTENLEVWDGNSWLKLPMKKI
jgi:hypothetical protein